MKFVVLVNIKELKEIFTPYILTALKEKYMKTYWRTCLKEINEEYEKCKHAALSFSTHCNTISRHFPKYLRVCSSVRWQPNVADFPKRYIYSSGLNCPNGFKELDP